MRSNKRHSKLILSREIVRALRPRELKGIAGGVIEGGGSNRCSDTCSGTCQSDCPCPTLAS